MIINRSEDRSYEEDLVQDVDEALLREIITVFSARLYGSRGHRNKKLVEKLRDTVKEIAEREY